MAAKKIDILTKTRDSANVLNVLNVIGINLTHRWMEAEQDVFRLRAKAYDAERDFLKEAMS